MYANNSPALAEGQWLYTQMNCVGCHAHGGGGMGPALMDDKWRYGGRIDQIAATITEGRPNGMPAWRGRPDRRPDLEARGLRPLLVRPAEQGRSVEPRR